MKILSYFIKLLTFIVIFTMGIGTGFVLERLGFLDWIDTYLWSLDQLLLQLIK